MAPPLSDEEKLAAASVPTYLIWRVERVEYGEDPETTPIAICMSVDYAELELTKRRQVFGKLFRFEKSGPSNVLYDYERRTIDATIARRLIEKFNSGERGAIELQ